MRWQCGRWTTRTVILLCGWLHDAHATAPGLYPEAAVKAAYVMRFAGYVTWPRSRSPPARLIVAVMGDDDVAANLRTLTTGRPPGDHTFEVRRVASLGAVGDAQILYVGARYRRNLKSLLAPLEGRDVLIVTDTDGALAAGSVINLLNADSHVRFEISLAAANRNNLQISSDLLGLAVRVMK